MKIGVFDSGIGGVTVLKEILNVLPNEHYIYYSDSKNNPYGIKNQKEIAKYSEDVVKFLLDKECDVIVIACNTASAEAANILRKKYDSIPIIAIEPAFKMAYDYDKDSKILVMATKSTIESEKFHNLFKKYDNKKTELLACVGLPELIENEENEKIEVYLNEYLKSYKGKIKNVVLGCTHFPLIKEQINNALGGNIVFFDGAEGLARHLKDIVKEKNLRYGDELQIEFYDSQNSQIKKERFFKYLKLS